MFLFVIILIVRYFQLIHTEFYDDPNNPIFDKIQCRMVCNGLPHTLCHERKQQNGNISCSISKSGITENRRQMMIEQLIMGHNGIRNRIANRMNVANMVEMVWKQPLAQMAQKYIELCRPYENDPCTMLAQNKRAHDQHHHEGKYGQFSSYCYIAQNRYYQQTTHYPDVLIENALRAWYLERDLLKAPTYKYNRNLHANLGYLEGENNFTHLASPQTSAIGCAFAKLASGFLLICNYHPYLRYASREVEFVVGPPGSMCPVTKPMRNKYGQLSNLCIGAKRNSSDTAKFSLIYINSLIILYLLHGL